MDLGVARDAALGAALEVGASLGKERIDPAVLQDTNNVVVWLRPYEVVAKVGIWHHSAEVLGREVAVCTHLGRAGAPVAHPIGGLRRAETSGVPVSLWRRVPATEDRGVDDAQLAEMLLLVHAGLRDCVVQLPSYLSAIEHAQQTLFDDDQMNALGVSDLRLLRRSFDEWANRAADWPAAHQPLHGEPHSGNVVITSDGPVLLDFEAASVGPMEWDLASLPPGVAEGFGDIDHELLDLLRRLNSARVATWAWALAEHPVMRWHAEHHLGVVRSAAAK